MRHETREPFSPAPHDRGRHDLSETALLDLLSLPPLEPGPLDREKWQQLLTLAERERVGPLVLASLQTMGVLSVPHEAMQVLTKLKRQAVEQVFDGMAQLSALLAELLARGVSPMALKGAAAARMVYSEPTLRPFGDLDLLVRMDEISIAHAVLVEMGYALAGGAPTAADLTWRHSRGYYDPRGARLSVDVHWRYIGYPNLLPLDYDGVFARASRVQVCGEPVLVPSAGDMLVMSALYFVREIWYRTPRLRYLRDIAEIGSRGAVDWDHMLRIASETRLLRSPLFLALAAATDLIGAPVPEGVLNALRPGTSAVTPLLSRIQLNALRHETSRAAVIQLAWMRWLDDPSLIGMAAWVKSLLIVPSPLVPSQRRWLRSLWRA